MAQAQNSVAAERAAGAQPPRLATEAGARGRIVFLNAMPPLKLRLIQRLETDAELYMATQEQDAPPIIVHTVNAYYVVYRSNSGRLYNEVKGGARAYMLAERGQLRPPQVYFMKLDKHRYEIGVRVPIDEEQVRQLIKTLEI
jgi:hypothetical protein